MALKNLVCCSCFFSFLLLDFLCFLRKADGTIAFFLVGLISGSVLAFQPVQAMPLIDQGMGVNSEQSVDLPRDPEMNKRLDAAADYINEKEWVKATSILQRLVEAGEDVFLKLTPEMARNLSETVPGLSLQGKDISIRSLSGRMLSLLPKDGLDIYKASYGPIAARQLKEAQEKSDLEQLSQVFRNYLQTSAGQQSAIILATYYLDRGDPLAAALCFDRLVQGDPKNEANISEITWLKAVLAFHLAGDNEGEDRIWKKMEQRGIRELTVGVRNKIAMPELRALVSRTAGTKDLTVSDWALVGGNTSRNGMARVGIPFLEPNWPNDTTVLERRFLPLPDRATAVLPPAGSVNTREKMAEATRLIIQDRNQVLIPSSQPLALDIGSEGKKISLAVYRSHGGLVARNLKSGAIHWANPIDWSMDRMAYGLLLSKKKHGDALDEWLKQYLGNSQKPNQLFENSTVGTISSDGQRVFTIVDFEIPPPQQGGQMGFPGGVPFDGAMNAFARFGTDVVDAVQQNRIEAFHLVTGKLLWTVGGRQGGAGDFVDSLFLGTPLPIGDRLYLLNERQQELRLVTLDVLSGKVLGIQRLCTVRDRIQQDNLRRTTSAQLAYSDGILVCPTNAGVIIGVELLTRTFVWAYAYHELADSGPVQRPPMALPGGFPPGFRPGRMPSIPNPAGVAYADAWKSSPPRISGGRVIFTAPDSKLLVCIGLKDGSLQWKQNKQDDDLYLAGITDGKVIVVGKKQVRALDLKNAGKVLWNLDTGTPSGFGAISENRFFLPLRDSGNSPQSEVCVIDIIGGKILSHTRSRKSTTIGNLVFHDGEMISLTGDHIAVYPQISAKLALIDGRIKANPEDSIGLMERGVMRLDKGDWQGAVDDLIHSTENQPSSEGAFKAREYLYEAFVEYFARDFTKAEPYLKKFESLCVISIPSDASQQMVEEIRLEEKKRKFNYLCLLAKGREIQGKTIDAFDTYLEIATFPGSSGFQKVNEQAGLRATPDVWARGRIASLVGKIDIADKANLERRISLKWSRIESGNVPLAEQRAFVKVYCSILESGRSAQLSLAKHLANEGGAHSLLQAEQDFLDLVENAQSRELSGRALVALGELYLSRNLPDDAAYCFRQIGSQYSEVIIDGIKGSQWLNSALADRRMAPFISGDPEWFSRGVVKALPIEKSGAVNRFNNSMNLSKESESLPFFRRQKAILQLNQGKNQYNQIRMIDCATGSETLSEILNRDNILTQPQVAQMLNGGIPLMSFQPGFQSKGHLILLESGNTVHVVDPLGKHQGNRHELWSVNLHNPAELSGMFASQLNSVSTDKNGNIMLIYQDGWRQRAGQSGVLLCGVVVLLTREGLMAFDSISGKPLWVRNDIKADVRIHGHKKTILVVDVDGDGKPFSTKSLSVFDGSSLFSPNLTAIYTRKILVDKGIIIWTEKSSDGEYVAATSVDDGRQIWRLEITSGAIFANSTDKSNISWVESDGRFRVVENTTGVEIFGAKVDPGHIQGTTALCLSDGFRYYLQFTKPPAAGTTVQSNFAYGVSISQSLANGEMYCFDKITAKLAWKLSVKNQMLITQEFAGLPIVMFVSKHNRPIIGINNRQFVTNILTIDKRTGKRLIDEEQPTMQQFQQFSIDVRRGKIELIAPGTKIIHQVGGPGIPSVVDSGIKEPSSKISN